MVNLTAAIERLTGRPHRLDGPYLICAEPGGDPYIATWDEAILGPRPTAEAMAAAGLEVAIEDKMAAIQAEKCRVRDAGFLVDGVRFDSDPGARMAYVEFAMELASTPSCARNWKASDGVWVTMDAALFARVKAAGEAHISRAFEWQAARDAALAAIKTAVAGGTMSTDAALAAVAAVSAVYTEQA